LVNKLKRATADQEQGQRLQGQDQDQAIQNKYQDQDSIFQS